MAAVRELKEEMGVDIRLKGQIAHSKGKYFEHYIFAADIKSGEPQLMEDSEEARRYRNDSNQYHVMWVPVDELTRENLKFYGAFYEHIVAVAAGKGIDEIAKLDVQSGVY